MPTETKIKTFFINSGGEYKELGTITDIDVTEEAEEDIMVNAYNAQGYTGELEVRDKETLRRLRKIVKTDKEAKAEQRYNKEMFRKFIKRRR